jgi:hypothetical protein
MITESRGDMECWTSWKRMMPEEAKVRLADGVWEEE